MYVSEPLLFMNFQDLSQKDTPTCNPEDRVSITKHLMNFINMPLCLDSS